MKQLTILLLIIIAIILILPVSISASSTDTIHITATGTGTDPVTDFVVTRGYIDETSGGWVETSGSWVNPITADSVIILRRFDRYPEAIDDGIIVYTGTGESFEEVVYGEDIDKIYYSAWTYGGGKYSAPVNYLLEVNPKMVSAVTLIGLIFLALIPTIAAFALKNGRAILAFVAAGGWLILGVYSYTQSLETWDISYAIFWLSMGMVIVCVLIATILKEKKEEITEDDWGDQEDLRQARIAQDEDNVKLDRILGRKPVKRNKPSSFSKTGFIGKKKK